MEDCRMKKKIWDDYWEGPSQQKQSPEEEEEDEENLDELEGLEEEQVKEIIRSPQISLNALNGNSLIVDLKTVKINEDRLGHLQFYIWNWPKSGRKGVKCKVKNRGWRFDILKWPKRIKACHAKCNFKHGKWKFDIWIWLNRKKKWEETCYGVCLLSLAYSVYLQLLCCLVHLSNNSDKDAKIKQGLPSF
ncbi:hypothetical protein Tco_0869434 [Tanacetum coccineum]